MICLSSRLERRHHNDKGEYFCPTCGKPIETLIDENEKPYKGCSTCHRNFDKEAEDELFEDLAKPYVSGITFSGGDPLFPGNRSEVFRLIKRCR